MQSQSKYDSGAVPPWSVNSDGGNAERGLIAERSGATEQTSSSEDTLLPHVEVNAIEFQHQWRRRRQINELHGRKPCSTAHCTIRTPAEMDYRPIEFIARRNQTRAEAITEMNF